MAGISAPPPAAVLAVRAQSAAADEAEGRQFLQFMGAVTGG